MSGIYIHIPFCRQACHYCDFHFSTSLTKQNDMVHAMVDEINVRKDYITQDIQTVYFGGGTPSLLTPAQLKKLLLAIRENLNLSAEVEITLEANPEDLTIDHCRSIYSAGVNRLSIGIQTFDDSKLSWMNRAHSSNESAKAFDNARSAGFHNISLDLIYAIPDHSHELWKDDLEAITKLDPEHISLYGLTIEEKTVFGKWERNNKLIQLPEDEAASQYLLAIDVLKEHGYIQYEVSNFGKEGFHSRHNNLYWSGAPYLGIGPGAHSFDGESTRRFNIRSNAKYLKAIDNNSIYWEEEQLSATQRVNEVILTSLRTKKGINLSTLRAASGIDLQAAHQIFLNEMRKLDMIELSAGFLRLKPKGFLVADEIALRLFISE